MNLIVWSTYGLIFQVMPVVVIDLKMPAILEDGMDRVAVQGRQLRRRLRINWSRRMSILRYGLRGFLENLRRTEDEKPILKREGEYFLIQFSGVLCCC